MKCRKCSGFMMEDIDPESRSGLKCINCGYSGEAQMATETCKKCEDPKAEDSVFCVKHRDLIRARNQRAVTKRKGLQPIEINGGGRYKPPRKTLLPAGPEMGGVIAGIDAMITAMEEKIEKLRDAREALIG